MKKKTDSFNARIDHSVQSPRLKDVDDNTYPAVESVLSALNKKDSNYPPLMVMEARLNMAKKNLTVAERYLKRALDREPNYFAALHLMGKYYYEVRQPVKAYEYLTKAVKAYASPPDFTTEDFYKETENVGESYAITGDIFYYFFDKVRFRYGDLSDELIDGETEKMVNYSVAREKYETAAKEGFESSEMHYNLGRIYYINHQYDRALDQWLHLYDDFVDSPELMFALGNAFYHLGNYEASKGEYLKLINVSENDADDIKTPDPGKGRHDSLFRSLSSSYNNIGAVYQKQNNESKSSVSYWKSIDYAKRISIENEFARVNLARSLNRLNKAEPILDENIPYSVKFYREDMRN
jgi:tetratricopeptide (TPR) repeat protein